MSKNKHNKNVGSAIDRSDDRINETGEVFTPHELVLVQDSNETTWKIASQSLLGMECVTTMRIVNFYNEYFIFVTSKYLFPPL